MILPRVIPCLLLKDRGLVKGVRFQNHKYVGDPINAVQIFNTKEVDEIMFLDIIATQEKRIPDLSLVQDIADQCLMPFCVGGGISTVNQARAILSRGAEKICINTSAFENPKLISELANVLGSASVVVSIDVKKNGQRYDIYIKSGTKMFQGEFLDIVRKIEALGAGEILINSIDRDGTYKGYDLGLIKTISNLVNIPVVAAGGAGSAQDLKNGIKDGASAVAAGSMFVFHGPRRAVLINFPNDKELSRIKIAE